MESSELYRRVMPYGSVESLTGGAAPPSHDGGEIVVTKDDLGTWCRLGKQWRESIGATPEIEALWRDLRICHKELVHGMSANSPRWWKTALALLVISDEACVDLGFSPHTASA